MTKTVCDICGKEMLVERSIVPISMQKFCITSYGKAWDICDECRTSLNDWITTHKQQAESVDISPNWVDSIVKKFKSRVSVAEINDVRPVSYEMFQKDKDEGLTIWLKNGDMLVYYPKGEADKKGIGK